MKRLECSCGSQVFFESRDCVHCGMELGFDPVDLEMHSLSVAADGVLETAEGRRYRLCANGREWDVCNWLCAEEDSHPLCWGCQFNRTVPDLSLPGNIQRWWVLEQGKKRLLYTLRSRVFCQYGVRRWRYHHQYAGGR